MKEYKEFTKGTFYEKLKQCIQEGYNIPTWEETKNIAIELSISRGRLLFVNYNYNGLYGSNYLDNNGRFVGVREKKQRSRKVKELLGPLVRK